jgi:hypothetical protein
MIPRRTVVVWAALIGSMTVSSGLLFWLEPRPMGPTSTSLSLAAVEARRAGQTTLFTSADTLQPERWKRIVIHHSGQASGSARSISQLHDALGYGSLGYHFVIGNGHGTGDGVVQIGPRWQNQTHGAYVPDAISICLVGNGDKAPPTRKQIEQLVRLIEALQQRLDIPTGEVVLHGQIAPTTSPGRHFPADAVRLRLLGLGDELGAG